MQTIRVDDQLEIKAYYAGHVLGAAMFSIRVGEQSLVYTVSPALCVLPTRIRATPLRARAGSTCRAAAAASNAWSILKRGALSAHRTKLAHNAMIGTYRCTRGTTT